MEEEPSKIEKFHSACINGEFETVLQFIESGQCKPMELLGIRVRRRRLRYRLTALHFAAAHGKLSVVRALIEKCGCNPRQQDSKYSTPLHFASYYGQIDVVRYLVSEQKCNPSSLSHERRSALQYALDECIYDPPLSSQIRNIRHLGVIKFLVTECLVINGLVLSQILQMACKIGSLADVKCLTETKIFNKQQETPMCVPRACGKLDILKYLIAEGYCDPQQCSRDGNTSVHVASRNGNLEILEYLIEEKHVDPEVPNIVGNTPLHLACMNNHFEIVEYLIIKRECNPNVQNKESELPLHIACRNQSLGIARLVSDFNPPPSEKAKMTPLQIACLQGSFEIAKYLVVERQWSPHAEDSNGYTALHYACGYGCREKGCINLELIFFLVKEHGCDPLSLIQFAIIQENQALLNALISINVDCLDKGGNSPLHLACAHRRIKILMYLAKEKMCNQTIQNSFGLLPLHIACQQRSLEMVELVSDCDVNTQAQNGDTPLHIACEEKMLEIVKYLVHIKGCSPPHHPDIYINLLIHVACESGNLALVRSITTPQNVNHKWHGIITPVHLACKQGSTEVVSFLVEEMHADINLAADCEYNAELPLHTACRLSSLELVQLVSGCKDVNYKNTTGNTPLHVACEYGTLEIVKFLIEVKRCDPKVENYEKELSLHISCKRQSLEMAKLVSHCDLNSRNHYGNTPLHLTCQLGAVNIAKYLVESGKCNLTIENMKGELPIHCACKHSLELVKLTGDYNGQNLKNITNAKGATPLHFACLYDKVDIVMCLIEEEGCNPTIPDKIGLKPLHYACGFCSYLSNESSNSDCVAATTDYLVTKCKCDPMEECKSHPSYYYDSVIELSKKTDDLISPLEKAVVERNLQLVKSLTSGSLNVNTLNCRGESILHVACMHKQLKIIEFLVEDMFCNQTIQNRTGELALHVACKEGCLDIVRLVSRCDTNVRTATGETALHIACKHSYIEIVEHLLINNQNCCKPTTITDNKGNLPLHIACEHNSLTLVKLVSNCDVNTKTKEGNTPLHIVLKQFCDAQDMPENFQIVEYLINEKVCDLTLPNNDGQLPLHIACEKHSLALVKLVSNCDVNATTKDENTPLHILLNQHPTSESTDERNQIVDHLVNQGCDSTIPNSKHQIPIHEVCEQGELEIVKLLINAANIGCRDKNGNTPLHIACSYKNLKVIEFLVGFNTSTVNSQNRDGNTPLHLACKNSTMSSSYMIIPCLVEVSNTQCNISISNNKGELPLHIACMNNTVPMTEIIRLAKSDPSMINSTTEIGDTPLHIACRRTSPTVADYFINYHSCNADIQNQKGELPLHIACQNPASFKAIIKWLHSKCNVNTADESGDTPLHIACRYGELNTVKYLVSTKQYNCSIVNNKGLLPLHIACCHGSLELVKRVSKCKNPNIQGSANDEVLVRHQKWHKTSIPIVSGDTPLHIACRIDELKLVEFLLKRKHSNVNISNSIGELPLHIACRSRSPLSLNIVQLLSNCDVNAQTKCGDTALHIAVRCSQSSVVKHLIQLQKYDINLPNEKGELPLHISCGQRCDQDIMELVTNMGNVNARTESGDTPLHIACRNYYGSETVNYLINIKGIDLKILNNEGEMPLHIACRNQDLDVAVLVSTCDMSVNTRNSAGNTPLLEVLMREPYQIHHFINYLITDKQCNPSLANKQNELPLHLACRQGCQVEIVKLVSGVDNINTQSLSGNSPLHEACKTPSLECALSTVEYLTEVMHCDSSVQNKNHELPLHLACRRKSLNMVKLVSKCRPHERTIEGNTPLHEVCIPTSESSHSFNKFSDSNSHTVKHVLNYLIEELGCKPQYQNKVGRTALHYLCESSTDIQAIEYLLLASKTELSVADNEGKTPIMLTTDLEITKMLLEHGADATSLYEMHHDFFRTKTPPPTPMNVLVVGNPSMGKTTLIESLKNETCEIIQTGQKTHTAGIIPNTFHSEVYGSVIFYDFAGQHEYYASHEAVVHNVIKQSPPVIIILVNIAEDKDHINKGILYWLSFLENRCTTMKENPHLFIVGSHADKCTEQMDGGSPEDTLTHITTFLRPRLQKSPLNFIACVAMDCRQSQSLGMRTLQQRLKQSSKQLRDTAVMNFTCHCFCVFLQDKLKQVAALPVDQIANTIMCYALNDKSQKNKPEALLPTDTQGIIKICEVLHEKGQLILLKNKTKPNMSWVILDKEILLGTINGTVFAPRSFKQHRDLSSSTGVVPFHKIATYFPDHDPNMIVEFLRYMEFCQEVHDHEVLDLLTPYYRATGPNSSSERYLFFPRLVSIETPQGVWDPELDNDYGYRWGWMLHCTEPDQFLTPHFLQVLILRLAFSFSLISSKPRSWDEMPAIKRICSVWKKGICWTCTSGVEAVVEVIGQNQAVVVMVRSCKNTTSELECVRLRSSIMKKILQAKKNFCPNTFTAESLIHPKCLQCPLASITKIILFPLPIVTQAVVEAKPFAVSDDNKTFSVEKLLLFEPYFHFDQSHLKVIFDPDNEQNKVQDDILQNITYSITEYTEDRKALEFKTKIFAKIFKVRHVMQERSKHESGIELLRVFRLWQSHSDGTYQCLRETLDEFSLFCGRNPLEFYTASNGSSHRRCIPTIATAQPLLSEESQRMLQNYDTLISQLAAAKCSGGLADKLRSRRLITDGVYEEGVNAAVESTRIRALIHAVHAKVKLSINNYHTFVTILRELGLEDIVQLLKGHTLS